MAPTAQKLVIVESPTKARTIRKYLGKDYRVEASMGHVRDLPANAEQIPSKFKGKEWARLGVDVEGDFSPLYIIPPDKKKVVTELKKALKDADEVYIATDEDREGESIGWHLLEVLKPKVPTHRMVFHEITKEAILRALASTREVDQALVNAQETRRVLDRLVGYMVSPVLWKKVKPRLSAGRVQSVAVRLLVLRERERMTFREATWWDLASKLEADGQRFDAQLATVGDKRIATGRDFDETTGELKAGADVLLLGEARAKALAASLAGAPFSVRGVERKESTRSPYAPFTTSTLQQEANRKLGFGARTTMQVAQRLYENGQITYMRTDSTHLSGEAISAARRTVEARYGADYLFERARQYATSAKGAQEAHEAIRPSGTEMRTAEELGLSGPEARLYDLIWKRTVATQMAEARIAFTNVTIAAKDPESGDEVTFRTSGREVLFPGFFRAYVEGSDDPDAALDDQSQALPSLREGQALDTHEVEARSHETRPPARYTEATLVKALEKEGIGRPSTYASIIDTIQNRGYVMAQGRQLVPTFTAMAVTQLLEKILGQIVDVEFTADMEQKLDSIQSDADALAYLQSFYQDQLVSNIDRSDEVDPKEICTVVSRRAGEIPIRVGRYGAYVEYENAEGERQTVSLPTEIPPADFDEETLRKLIADAERGDEPLGTDPETGMNVYVLTGRFGPYIQLGENDGDEKPKRSSLPPGKQPMDVDLDYALQLLSLPRPIGDHPEGGLVEAGLGRYGPYVKHGRTFASLGKQDDLFTVGLDRALTLIEEKKKKGRRGAEPLRELGEHPEEGGMVAVYEGRYGPYVKHGKINATLPKEIAAEAVDLDTAVELIAKKAAAKGGAKKTRARKAPAKKRTASKTGAKKAPAKKRTTSKTGTKKAGAG